VDDARVNPHHEPRTYEDGADCSEVDEIVQHTDAGDGTTQREHWPSNVEGPGPDGGVR